MQLPRRDETHPRKRPGPRRKASCVPGLDAPRKRAPTEGVLRSAREASPRPLRSVLLRMGARAMDTRGNPLHLIFAVELHFLELDFF